MLKSGLKIQQTWNKSRSILGEIFIPPRLGLIILYTNDNNDNSDIMIKCKRKLDFYKLIYLYIQVNCNIIKLNNILIIIIELNNILIYHVNIYIFQIFRYITLINYLFHSILDSKEQIIRKNFTFNQFIHLFISSFISLNKYFMTRNIPGIIVRIIHSGYSKMPQVIFFQYNFLCLSYDSLVL